MGTIEAIRNIYLEETAQFIMNFTNYYPPHRIEFAARNFHILPTIDRQVVSRVPEMFMCRSDLRARMFFTGSTSGVPLALFRSAEEQVACRSVFDRLFMPSAKQTSLSLESFNHGVFLKDEPVLPFSLREHFELALDFLEQGLPSPKGRQPIKILSGSTLAIKALTLFSIDQGRSLGTSLDHILLSSTHMTSTWKKRVSDYSGARLRKTYGLSEFCEGNAWECPDCGLLHFPPTVYVEIDGFGNTGELILSSLYPFSQVQLFLRYRTGDIFRRHDKCSLYDDWGYSFFGRKVFCPTVVGESEEQAWVSPLSVAEVLDALDLGDHADHRDLHLKVHARNLTNRIFEISKLSASVVVIKVSGNATVKQRSLAKDELLHELKMVVGEVPESNIHFKFVRRNKIAFPFLY